MRTNVSPIVTSRVGIKVVVGMATLPRWFAPGPIGPNATPPPPAQRLGDAGAVRRIGTGAIGNVPLLDVQPGIAHRARRVLEQRLALSRIYLPEQVARLLPVIIVEAMIVVRRVAFERERRLGEFGLVVPKSCAVGIVSERSA